MSYRPISILSDCGNGYGIALVADGDNPPVRAGVDLNATDGTATPRIQVNGAWVEVDATFADAYRGITASHALTGDDRTTSCRVINGGHDPAPDGPVDPGIARVHPFWPIVVPTLAAGASFGINYLAYPDLYTASRDPGSVGTILTLGSIGSKSLYAATFTTMTRHSDPAWTYSLSGIHAAGGLIFLGVAFAQPSGRGTPWLGTSVDMMTNGGLGFCYGDRVSGRDSTRFGVCAAVQGGLGAAYLIMGLAGVGERGSVSPGDMYAPPGMAGARDVPGNPSERTAFPAMNLQLRDSGIAQLLGLVLNTSDYLWISRAGERPSGTADGNRPTLHLGALTPAGGGFGLQAYGTW
jgi:hypothetical protein